MACLHPPCCQVPHLLVVVEQGFFMILFHAGTYPAFHPQHRNNQHYHIAMLAKCHSHCPFGNALVMLATTLQRKRCEIITPTTCTVRTLFMPKEDALVEKTLAVNRATKTRNTIITAEFTFKLVIVRQLFV